MASFGQHRRAERSQGGAVGGGRQPTLAKPKSACNSPQPKETTKGAQGFFPCRLELQRHIIKIFIERWLVGAGVGMGGRSLGVAITIAHLRPQAACLPASLVSYHLPAPSVLLLSSSLASAKFNLYCATNADREPSPAGSSVASAPKVATEGDRQTRRRTRQQMVDIDIDVARHTERHRHGDRRGILLSVSVLSN